MLAIVLSENYCTFADVIRRQIEGFATGAACASQVAHLHLEEMLAPIFELVADSLRFHRRYIDDGLCILRCSRQRAEDLFAQIIRTATFIQAWRAPKSLGRTLIPYTFTNNETSLPPDPAPL